TPTRRDADDARHIRVESGVEAVRDLSRLYSLYLPEASVVADDTRTMGTDAHGHATMRIPRQENECIDLLIDSAEDEEHKVLVAAFGGGGVTEGAARQAPPESRVFSYDSGRATAWILPQICDAGS